MSNECKFEDPTPESVIITTSLERAEKVLGSSKTQVTEKDDVAAMISLPRFFKFNIFSQMTLHQKYLSESFPYPIIWCITCINCNLSQPVNRKPSMLVCRVCRAVTTEKNEVLPRSLKETLRIFLPFAFDSDAAIGTKFRVFAAVRLKCFRSYEVGKEEVDGYTKTSLFTNDTIRSMRFSETKEWATSVAWFIRDWFGPRKATLRSNILLRKKLKQTSKKFTIMTNRLEITP